MLAKINCEKFHQKKIRFANTLNVVLGTNTGDNSIGKSTFMLIVDFAFGGTTYAGATDIIDNIGSHDIYFKFIFAKKDFFFCRNNIAVNTVWVCDENQNRQYSISLQEYCAWLSKMYCLDLPLLSFRDGVGRYIRAYGKANCDEKHPLHYVPTEPANKSIIALLKLFDRYSIIADLESQAVISKDTLKAYKKAQSLKFVSKIGKREYQQNIEAIKHLEMEIQEISSSLEDGLLDIDVVTSEQAIQIKSELSRAKRLRSNLYSKLSTIDDNGNYQFSHTTDEYSVLLRYFPQADLKHIGEIEDFHKKVSAVFKQEINTERKKLISAIEEYSSIIQSYEMQLKELIQNPQVSKIVLQQHAEALKK